MSESFKQPRIGAPELGNLGQDERLIVEGAINRLGGPFGPRMPLLHSPEVAVAWSKMGLALKRSTLKEAWREIAILVVGQHWQADFEWHAHAPRAALAGVTPAQLKAIKNGDMPTFDDQKTGLVHTYCYELVHTNRVSDLTYDATRALLGDKELVELTALLGHFTNVAMTLNAHHVQLPPGVSSPFGRPTAVAAKAQVPRTAWLARDSESLRFRMRPGKGPILVFVHELGGSLESWDACIGFLPADRATLSFEWRGAGLSSKVRKPATFDQLVEDLRQVVEHVCGSGPVVLIGVAAGAAAALSLAARAQCQVVGVVAVTPALGTPAEQRDAVANYANRIEQDGIQVMMGMERTYPIRLREEHPERWEEFRLRCLGNDTISYAHLLRMVMDVTLSNEIGRIPCPALVIGGTVDIRPIDMMKALAAQIPRGVCEVIDAGHFMPSQAPDRVAQAIERFVAALSISASTGV